MTRTVLCIDRRMFMLGTAATLAGCAAKPIALDRQAMANVHRLALPTPAFPPRPGVAVLNGVATKLPGVFGLIGAVATATTMSHRQDALIEIFAAKGFDGQAYFNAQLAQRLAARTLATTPIPADAHRNDFLPAYPPFPDDGALLDIVVTAYGLVAENDSDSSPYRPAVGVKLRLIAPDKSVMMQDALVNLGIQADPAVPDNVPTAAFTTFTDVRRNPDGTVVAMKQAFDYAADVIDRRIA